MKKHRRIFVAALNLSFAAAICFSACQSEHNGVEITNKVHYDDHYNVGRPEFLHAFCEYDSIAFSDGSWAVYYLQRAPQNSLIEYRDKNGRVQATISQASECYAQYVIYGYNQEERLEHLIIFGEHELEEQGEKVVAEWGGIYATPDYLTFKQRMQEIDFSAPKLAFYEQIDIEYDGFGFAKRLYSSKTDKEIVAPDGYWLDIDVEQCVSFWESDLSGGEYLLKTTIRPIKSDIDNYTEKHYVFLQPSFEQNFQDGVVIRSVLYDNSELEDDVLETREFKDEGGKHIYTSQVRGDIDIYVSIWENDLLRTEQVISQYGTVLKQTNYLYNLPSTQVVKIEEKLNFTLKKLEQISTKNINLWELPKEGEMMDLLTGSSCWEECY